MGVLDLTSIIYDHDLHSKLLEVGRKLEKHTTHSLENPFVETILSTLEYFGASQAQLSLVAFDLIKAKYKIWDWLGMAYSGRIEDPNNSSSTTSAHNCIEKMVKLYIFQNHVGGFAWWLRGHDLDIEEPSRCEDCIKSYDQWHNRTPQEIKQEQEDMKKLYGDNIF